jgi:ankyrin repeat protein
MPASPTPNPADSALFAAVAAGDEAAVRDALARGASASARRLVSCEVDRQQAEVPETVLQVAIATGSQRIVAMLLAAGADATVTSLDGDDAFAAAVARGDQAFVREMAKRGVPSSARALEHACFRGAVDLAEACCRGDVTPATTPVLAVAARGGSVAMLAWLLDRGADLAGEGVLALCEAANAGKADACALLLQRGVPANCRNDYAWPPLHFAAWNADRRTCDVLLAAGADPRAVCGEERTAADWAAAADKPELAAHLQRAITAAK